MVSLRFFYIIFAVISLATNAFSYSTNCSALDDHRNWHFTADKFDFDLNITKTMWNYGPILFDGHILQSNTLSTLANGRCFPEESWTDSVRFNRIWSDANGKTHVQFFDGSIYWDQSYFMSGWYCDEENIVNGGCKDTSLRWNAAATGAR